MRIPPVLVLGLLALPGCAGPGESGKGSGGRPDAVPDAGSWTLVPVASGLDRPVYVVGPDDGTGRLFVVEQEGRIRIIENGSLLAQPFLDLTSRIVAGGEQGLLGLAFHPRFRENGRFFVDYTNRDGDTVVAGYEARAGSDRADERTGRTILTQDQPFSNHNGGMIEFGPDGYLYIAFGDGGGGGDPSGNGQNTQTFLAKLLRIDVDRGDPYAVPDTNPFKDGITGRPEVWAYGLRNPWRFSFDRATGDLWIGDVGQNAWEEIDRQGGASRGGENYGWSVYEGNHPYRAGVTLKDPTFPVAEYANEAPHCSVTGGYVYGGQDVPALAGLYVFGDYCSGQLWTLRPDGDEWRRASLADTSHMISSFGQDASGELYVVDHEGAIFRFARP